MPVFGLDNLLVGIIFFIFAIWCILITREINFKRKENNSIELREGVYNSALTAILCMIMGLFYVIPGLIVAFINNTIQDSLYLPYPTPTATFAIYFLGFVFIFIAAFVIYEWKTAKFSKVLPKEQKIHKVDKELSRKAFHILIIGVLAVYLIVGKLLIDSLYTYLSTPAYDYWGYRFADWSVIDSGKLVSMFGITVVFEFIFLLDLIRLKAPRYFPARILSNLYREKEKDTLGPHIYLVVGILFSVIVFPPPIAMAVIAISALGDATATIVGVTKGKRRMRSGISNKTWEGSIAGMIASFLFGFIGFIALAFTPTYFGYVKNDIGTGILIGLLINAAAVPIFFLIDYYTPKPLPFSDNLLNPILVGFTMWGVYTLFF
ncbi:MAG: diacylglycerol/polyprenol kinase family protein, partial [Promethearchaeota archaeon]